MVRDLIPTFRQLSRLGCGICHLVVLSGGPAASMDQACLPVKSPRAEHAPNSGDAGAAARAARPLPPAGARGLGPAPGAP